MPQFQRYIGIDYSGAGTPESSCKGLRVYVAEDSGKSRQVQPPPSPRRYWTRRGLAVAPAFPKDSYLFWDEEPRRSRVGR